MEALCNTIAGDAPLYTMFRKGGDLVKCPFRGPFSFSYSKGGRGQVCEYPPSYLDSCSDNQKMKLKYQACLDVEGSEVESELVWLGMEHDLLMQITLIPGGAAAPVISMTCLARIVTRA